MRTFSSSTCDDPARTRFAPPGCARANACSTSPQQARVGVAGRGGRAEPLRQQLPRPGRPSRGPRRRPRRARSLGLRHGQRPLHLRHAGAAQAAGARSVASSSAPTTRSSIPPAGTPTADCSRRFSAAEDAVISDELNHASIIDGVRLCKAQRFRYRNNDMADLEAKLEERRGGALPADRHRRRVFDGRDYRRSARRFAIWPTATTPW